MSATDRRRRIAHIVTKLFGLSGLRPGQQAVIDGVLAGRHTLAVIDDTAQQLNPGRCTASRCGRMGANAFLSDGYQRSVRNVTE